MATLTGRWPFRKTDGDASSFKPQTPPQTPPQASALAAPGVPMVPWQHQRFRKSALFTITEFGICHFCTAQNIRYFTLKICMIVEHNIVNM
jgi:hypothetical protein